MLHVRFAVMEISPLWTTQRHSFSMDLAYAQGTLRSGLPGIQAETVTVKKNTWSAQGWWEKTLRRTIPYLLRWVETNTPFWIQQLTVGNISYATNLVMSHTS